MHRRVFSTHGVMLFIQIASCGVLCFYCHTVTLASNCLVERWLRRDSEMLFPPFAVTSVARMRCR